MKVKHVKLMPWKWSGLICAGGTVDEYRAFVKRHIKADVDPGVYSCGHAYVEYGVPWLIWVDRIDNFPALAHEALHVASGVLEARGLKHTAESEEAYTYTMEEILRQAVEKHGWKVNRAK